LNNGNLTLFYQSDLNSIDNLVNIVISSTSIPVYFSPHYYRERYYVDGGVDTDEIVRPGILACMDKGYTNIEIDVILTSQTLKKLTNKEIADYNLFDMMYRTYSMLDNTFSNHQLYSDCDHAKHKFNLNLYNPDKPFPGGLLDFDSEDLKFMYNMGYHTRHPKKVKYCF